MPIILENPDTLNVYNNETAYTNYNDRLIYYSNEYEIHIIKDYEGIIVQVLFVRVKEEEK